MAVATPPPLDRASAHEDVERARLEAIRNRRASPDAYIEYQKLAGRVLLERLARWIEPAGARVLEVGCGPGGIALALAEGGAEVHAIDRDQYDSPLPDAQSYARRHGITVGLARADAVALPYRDEQFACVVCSSVIEHLDDPAGSLCEMRRVLRLGGIALVDFPLFRGPYGGHIDDVVRAPWFHLRPRAQVEARLERVGAARELALYRSLNQITQRRFRGMVRAAGFEIAEFRRMHYLTHPGRKLLAGIAEALRTGSARAAGAALLAAPRDFTLADAAVFPLLLGLVPLSLVPGLDEYATTGVRFVLRRPAR